MDTRITTDPTYASQLVQDLLSLPTMSIVTDQANLFDPVTGIYANATESSDMEVPASLEYFDPATGQTFQINAALRMQGGVGRYAGLREALVPLRLQGPLRSQQARFPLVRRRGHRFVRHDHAPRRISTTPGSGARTRPSTSATSSPTRRCWRWASRPATATTCNCTSTACTGDCTTPPSGPTLRLPPTYLGGDKDNWDAINADESINDSDMTEYNQLANFDFQSGSTAAYQQVQGNNPDGTRNPTYPVLLDMNNFVDYMLMNFYIGNIDWPSHNWYMARPEDSSPTNLDSTGFKFFPWDSEMATGLQWAYDPNINSIGAGSWDGWVASTFQFADEQRRFPHVVRRSCAEVPLQRRRADRRRRAGPLPGVGRRGPAGHRRRIGALGRRERHALSRPPTGRTAAITCSTPGWRSGRTS